MHKKISATNLVSLLLALVMVLGITTPSAAAATSTKPTTTTATTVKLPTAGTTKVAYGASKYPNLASIGYDTYRKLDYKEKSNSYTYFYDFRNDWYAGASAEAPEKGPYSNQPGLYGVVASTSGNTLTFTAYTEISNAKVTSAKLLTYDNAKAITLEATANKEISASTAKLANGPYILGIWFSYTDDSGKTTTVSVGRTLYVSNGKGYFAERAYKDSDAAMQSWLTKNRNDLAADDAFQAWVAKQGGNDLDKATSLTGISYPFKSGTTRYPNNASKWRQLAHEICPDENAGDYTKAAALFDWMSSNLAYDRGMNSNGVYDYRWAVAASTGTGTGFTTWDSHFGKCEDFANIYTIMARELGIPSHMMTDPSHAWSIVRINGRWEVVDPTAAIRKADLGTDNKTFVASAKAYWANEKTGDDYKTVWTGFIIKAANQFTVGSWEKYDTIEEKFADTKAIEPLDDFLHTAAYYTRWNDPLYSH